jgi:hypothetical protein
MRAVVKAGKLRTVDLRTVVVHIIPFALFLNSTDLVADGNFTVVPDVAHVTTVVRLTRITHLDAAGITHIPGCHISRDFARHLPGNIAGHLSGNITRHFSGHLSWNVARNVAGDFSAHIDGRWLPTLHHLPRHLPGNFSGHLARHLAGDLLNSTDILHTDIAHIPHSSHLAGIPNIPRIPGVPVRFPRCVSMLGRMGLLLLRWRLGSVRRTRLRLRLRWRRMGRRSIVRRRRLHVA